MLDKFCLHVNTKVEVACAFDNATAGTAKSAKLTETWKKPTGREMPSNDAKSG